jgi:outer membrane receptor for ferrienterochelin and colicins
MDRHFTTCRLSKAITLVLLGTLASQIAAQEIEEIKVLGVRQRLEQAGVLKDTIERTEMVGATQLENTRSISLTEALSDSPGVDVAVDCSLCGMKRVRLNGLRAEHTTVLVDGLPSHTIASGFYGIDAIAMTGIDEIEVARGAGAALLTPEAIGGVVNIVTTDLAENTLSIDLSGGELGFRQAGVLGTLSNLDGSTRATIIGQFDERDQADEDGNGISENPYLKNRTLSARVNHEFSYRDSVTARINFVKQTSFGGPVPGDTVASIDSVLPNFAAHPEDTPHTGYFQNGDVNQRWLAQPWETTEWVDTKRDELSLSWLHEFNADWNMELAGSYARHQQDSFYEGFNYYADDKMDYMRGLLNWRPHEDHLVTFGFDWRDESLDSHSNSGTSLNTDNDPATVYISDAFDYSAKAFFIQDAWNLNLDLEMKAAVRFDKVSANFTDPLKPGTEIDQSVASPRLDLRYFHNDAWVSRISVGRGYRAPLSFFETDHGMLDSGQGFLIEINNLERSTSVGYTLSYDAGALSANGSLSWTEVSGLAMLSERDGVPLLGQLDSNAAVTATDLTVGYRLNSNVTLNLVAEKYFYDSRFEQVYAIAPVEEQVSLSIDADWNGWDFTSTLNVIGARNLGRYNYNGYERLLPNGYIDESAIKGLHAKAYMVLDTRLANEVGDHLTVYGGANNLLNYSQARNQDSSLFWVPGDRDATGLQADGFDVVYIHGPLRPREFYLGVKYAY